MHTRRALGISEPLDLTRIKKEINTTALPLILLTCVDVGGGGGDGGDGDGTKKKRRKKGAKGAAGQDVRTGGLRIVDDEADMVMLDRRKVNKAWEDPEAEGMMVWW